MTSQQVANCALGPTQSFQKPYRRVLCSLFLLFVTATQMHEPPQGAQPISIQPYTVQPLLAALRIIIIIITIM